MKLPEFFDEDEKQLSREKAKRSRTVSSGRQVIERCVGRVKQCRLFRRPFWQMSPKELREWLHIAAMLSNRYKKPLTQ